MNFSTAALTCLQKYAVFSGRASKSEFWWFYIFSNLTMWGATVVGYVFWGVEMGGLLSGIVSIGFFLPSIAVASRRLHDIGKSGWRQLLALTIIGAIPLTIWCATDTKKEDNKFGPKPDALLALDNHAKNLEGATDSQRFFIHFNTAISACMGKYAVFSDRASRSEFWLFYLFVTLMVCAAIVTGYATFGESFYGNIFAVVWSLPLLLPCFAVGTRRLHDIGKSGQWQLLALTIIGLIPLIIWLTTDTKKGNNEFGSSPKPNALDA